MEFSDHLLICAPTWPPCLLFLYLLGLSENDLYKPWSTTTTTTTTTTIKTFPKTVQYSEDDKDVTAIK